MAASGRAADQPSCSSPVHCQGELAPAFFAIHSRERTSQTHVYPTKMMNRQLLSALILTSLAAFPAAAFSQDHGQDEAEIRNVEKQQQEAWNHHDAKAYANLFTEDGEVVNVVGWWWRGKAEIEKKLTDAYAFVFRESALTISDVQVKFLTPEIVVAHVKWTMVGARTPKGIPEPQQGIQIQVLQKQAGKWLIASFQNTNSIPERPFPKGPPSADLSPSVKP
jgi:uncharacterized protein (TIGR02246 family)